jgi:hypothetical protein
MGSRCHHYYWQGARGSPALIAVCAQTAVCVINHFYEFSCALRLHFPVVMIQCYIRASYMLFVHGIGNLVELFGVFRCCFAMRSINIWETVGYNNDGTHTALFIWQASWAGFSLGVMIYGGSHFVFCFIILHQSWYFYDICIPSCFTDFLWVLLNWFLAIFRFWLFHFCRWIFVYICFSNSRINFMAFHQEVMLHTIFFHSGSCKVYKWYQVGYLQGLWWFMTVTRLAVSRLDWLFVTGIMRIRHIVCSTIGW